MGTDMATGSPLPRLRALLRHERLEEALRGVIDLFRDFERDDALAARGFPFPEFDALCAEIGRASAFELFGGAKPACPAPHDLVLMTETFVQGGHAEIVKDLADWGERKLVLAATNLHNRKNPILPELAAHARVAEAIVLDEPTLLARLRSLQAAAANPACKRVLVLCHGNDAVAIAAAAAVEGKPVLFFHHCDHSPCLGCFMPSCVHVDLHNLAFEQCRTQLGIAPAYICLTSRDGTAGHSGRTPGDPVFKSITCGAEHKLLRLRYPIAYTELVVRLVAAHGGMHFHVGPLSEGFVPAVGDALEAAGLPRDAFVPVGHVGGFRDIIEALEIDLYVPTLPQAGGKALIDAMAAGVPILVHENAIDRLWGGRDLVYPTAPGWSSLDELDGRLRQFADIGYCHAQAADSRAYYERHHSNALFASMLRADGMLDDAFPPPLKPYRPGLDAWLAARAMHTQAAGR